VNLTGKLLQKLAPQTGKSARGEWKRQDFIVETQEKFPKKVCLSNWNDKVDLDGAREGDLLSIDINIESREYNGRWYTDVKPWRMSLANGGGSASQGNTPPPPDMIPPSAPDDMPGEDDEILPF